MLALFLSLIEKLIKIVELRESDRKQLFKEVAEPLFNQLQPVIDDYFGIFHRARALALMSKRHSELKEAVVEIREQREKMLQARRAAAEFAAAVQQQVAEKRIKDFAGKVALFFRSTTVLRHNRHPSGPSRLVELFDYVANESVGKAELIDYIDQMLRRMEEDWVAVAQSYASLRIHCMAPDRYRHEG